MAVPVHNHSMASIPSGGDGYATPAEIADRIEALGMPGAFVTDHGTVEAFREFTKAMHAKDLFAGLGIEAYQAANHRTDRPGKGEGRDGAHVILLAQNKEGLLNLNRMSDEASRTGFYYKPRMDWELLEKHNEGIICTSACMAGLVAKGIQEGDHTALNKYLNIFGDRFYIELHTYDHPDQVALNKELVSVAQQRGIPVVYANDAHMACAEDHDMHELLIASRRNQCIHDDKGDYSNHPDDSSFYHPNSLFIMSEDEVRQSLDYLPESVVDEAISNSDVIGDACRDVTLPKSRMHMPEFNSGDDRTTNDVFLDEVEAGIIERYGEHFPDEVWQRVSMEAKAIMDADLAAYFLIKQDLVRWCERKGILVGPGRGSAAGSILAYALRITAVCPLKYGLQFERFWNPGRAKGFPDIDIDIEQRHRPAVKKYLIKRWGEDRVLSIGTKSLHHPKGALRTAARAIYGKKTPYQDLDKITKIIDELNDAGFEATWEEIWEKRGEELREFKDEYESMFDAAEDLTGRVSTFSIHASAIIISDVDLPDYLPARMAARKGDDGTNAKELVTQVDMNEVEAAGFLKADVLGLRNLDTLSLTAELAGEKGFDFRGIDLDNLSDEAWALIPNKQTLGLFQIEEGGAARRIGKALEPKSIDDLAAIVALNRPGPLRSGAVDSYIARKNEDEVVTYPHEILADILSETYGLMIYQEQIISYFRAIGYSMSDADHIRKIIGKKKREDMEAEYPTYMKKATQIMSEEKADEIWHLIEDFSKYGFNKSHAVAYAFVLAWTMYAKSKWPTEFIMASILTRSDIAGKYVAEGRRIGVDVLPPCVNNSEVKISQRDGKVYYGLRDIKFIGEPTARWIIKHGPYESYDDFLDKYDEACEAHDELKVQLKEAGKSVPRSPGQIVGSGRIEHLWKAGAFENIDPDEETDVFKRAELQEEYLGMSFVDPFAELKDKYAAALEDLDDLIDLNNGEEGEVIETPAVVSEIRKVKTKNGKNPGQEMAIIQLTWNDEQASAAIFPKYWKQVRHVLRPNTMAAFALKVNDRGVNVEEVMRLD